LLKVEKRQSLLRGVGRNDAKTYLSQANPTAMKDPEEALAMGESSVDAEGQAQAQQRHTHCLNCNAQLQGPFCSQCGQKDLPRRQNLVDLLTNFISSFFSFESKFFNTLNRLLFKPGTMAKMYNHGKRERFYHPARMYVFLSFLFFAFSGLVADQEDPDSLVTNQAIQVDPLSEIPQDRLSTAETVDPIPESKDSLSLTLPFEENEGPVFRFFSNRVKALSEKDLTQEEIIELFNEAFANNIPKMVFLLLPFFALLLKLVYLRKDFYYAEHLVFSVFYYCFFFFAGTLIIIFDEISWLNWLVNIVNWYIFIYLFLAMKTFYGQTWKRTFLKFSLVLLGFTVLLVFALLGNALATLATL
jgi:hypothetical protein